MAKMRYKIFRSLSTDPRINLSLEEYFLSTVGEKECIVLFWQSENAVVIGRNQNPYQECNLSRLDENNVILVRRLSGGGAVYHDLGNLNFAFISKTSSFNIDQHFSFILESLKALGIDGEFNGRNDLIALGRKFSGNAFVHEDDGHLHHGTLLIDTNVDKISNYLSVSHHKLENKGFDSIKSRVINLTEINKNISVEKIVKQVIEVISKGFEVEVKTIYDESEMTHKYIDKYKSHLWNFGESPNFDCQFEEKFSWGLFSLQMTIAKGCIDNIMFFTDAMDSESFYQLNNALKNQVLNREIVFNAIGRCNVIESVQNDLKGFFDQHIFS